LEVERKIRRHQQDYINKRQNPEERNKRAIKSMMSGYLISGSKLKGLEDLSRQSRTGMHYNAQGDRFFRE